VRALAAIASFLSLGCFLAPGPPDPTPTPLWIRSHNQSPIDIYVQCGGTTQWLGTIGQQGAGDLKIPAENRLCARGVNFFLVVEDFGRGYWVGPVAFHRGQAVQMVIEKYAGLSSAEVLD
jgi:hypothetical protein